MSQECFDLDVPKQGHDKETLRLEPLTRVAFADALLSNTDAHGTLTAASVPEPIDLSSSCAILFYGTNNKDQPGFDILIHQPRTDSEIGRAHV